MLRAILSSSFLGIAVLIALSVTACSSSDNKREDDTARPISDQDLSQMVLRLEQYPREYQAFNASDNNGMRTLDDRVGEAFDHDKTRARLQKFAFVSGYHLAFRNAQFDSTMPGVLTLGSDVDLFADANGATGDFQQSTADILSEKGVTTTDITVDDVELFEYKLADQAAGARYNFTIKRDDGSQFAAQAVQVALRHGRLEGAVTATFFGFNDLDKANIEGRVKDLARQLDDQIAHVLSSTVPPSPSG